MDKLFEELLESVREGGAILRGEKEALRIYVVDVPDQVIADQQLLGRITINPKVMVGKPVIKGTRLTVEYILNLLTHEATTAEILEEYEGLTEYDIHACLLFASRPLKKSRDKT